MTAESNRGADGTFVCVWRDPPEPTTERLAPGGDIYAALSADGALTPGSTLYHPLFVGVRFHAPIAGGALTASRDPAPPNVAVLLRGLQHRNDAAADVAARGGALYSACERAGARGAWGALDARTRYYAWAARAADGGGLRFFALREPLRGCVELQFDRRADRVVLAAPRAGVALGGSPGAAAAKPASADELRRRRLAALGGGAADAPPPTPAPQPAPPAPPATRELRDALDVAAGASVSFDASAEFAGMNVRWLFARDGESGGVITIDGAARPILTLYGVGLDDEGEYWCESLVPAGAVAPSRRCRLQLVHADRASLARAASAARTAEHALGNGGSANGEVASLEAARRALDGALDDAAALWARLPTEQSTLLTLRSRVALALAATGDDATARALHFSSARRDAAAALRLIPGDRAALLAHAAAAEAEGRLSDAIESLETLRRMQAGAQRGSVDARLATLKAKLESEREDFRREFERAAAERAAATAAEAAARARADADTAAGGDGADDYEGAEQQRRRRRAEEAEASRRRRARDADARSRAPPRSAADGTAAWRERYDEYERRWAAWEADEAAGPGELPCPLSLELAGWHLCGLPPGAPRAEKRRAVKRALLRWHPDKLLQRFGARFAGDGGDAALELAAATARELNTLNAEVG